MYRAWNLAMVARKVCNDSVLAASRHKLSKLYTPQMSWTCLRRRQICSTGSLRCKSEEELKEDKNYEERLAKIRAEDAASTKLVHLRINPGEVKISKAVVSKYVHSFERAVSFGKTKENFIGVIDNFLVKDRTRRGHMEFLKAAMHYVEEFGLVKDVETYNKMLDVFPRGRFENRTLFDAIWAKQHPQAILALDILTLMEDNWVLPNEDTYDILYEIFGHASQPLQKCKRLVYWYQKLEEMFPNPYPKILPESDSELSKLVLARMTKDDQIITIYKDNSGGEVQEFLVGSQTEDQKKMLENYMSDKPLYVEGPFFIWVRRLQRHFFTLRTDAEFDEENGEGNVVAICMSHANASEELLRSWITNLQSENPQLANISVIFNLSQTPQ
ncbi:hypothetical protein ACROYT_G038025 [Oculina patagonica]